MTDDTTIVFGMPVTSADPVFLAVVRLHIILGAACVAAGITAMLSCKGRGRHSTAGAIYHCSSAAVRLHRVNRR
jgi:hypothetical protein